MTTATLTLTEFLLARIAEDEDWADNVHDVSECSAMEWGGMTNKECDCGWPERVLGECEAKRRIVTRHAPQEFWDAPGGYACAVTPNVGFWPCADLKSLAAVYADHPDHRPEWRA